MTPELENYSIKAPINSLTEDVKIVSQFNLCHSLETISSKNFKMNKAFEKSTVLLKGVTKATTPGIFSNFNRRFLKDHR